MKKKKVIKSKKDIKPRKKIDSSADCIKIIYLLRASFGKSREEIKNILLYHCSPRLIDSGAQRIEMYITDDESRVKKPVTMPRFERGYCSAVCIHMHKLKDIEIFRSILTSAGFMAHAYRVEESIYTEYGSNKHSGPRNWPDGKRSPGTAMVTLLTRPRRLNREEWISRWFGRMSPISEAIQPRTRYVRNIVLETITDGARPFDGIVMELWPSNRHITNKKIFYGADSAFSMINNMFVIFKTVKSFLNISDLRFIMSGEYFLKTDFVSNMRKTTKAQISKQRGKK